MTDSLLLAAVVTIGPAFLMFVFKDVLIIRAFFLGRKELFVNEGPAGWKYLIMFRTLILVIALGFMSAYVGIIGILLFLLVVFAGLCAPLSLIGEIVKVSRRRYRVEFNEDLTFLKGLEKFSLYLAVLGAIGVVAGMLLI